MNIAKIIKEHHKMMIEKGFYPDGEDKNIGELLMLIVSELGEALEAHRCNRFTNWDNYDRYFKDIPKSSIDRFSLDEGSLLMYRKEVQHLFECQIKDTFEDEIADVFLRLFDLCGYMEIEPYEMKIDIDNNIGTALLDMATCMCMIGNGNKEDQLLWFNRAFSFLIHFSKKHNIPIEKHIRAKMAYNKTRPYKHGKAY